MKVLVLAGGLSPERDVSLSTGTQVCNALRRIGHEALLLDLFYGLDPLPLDIDAAFSDKTQLPPYAIALSNPDLAAVRASRPDSGLGTIGKGVIELCRAADIVFLALHGEPGECGMVQAMFDMMEIPYTGAGYFGSALAMDKAVSKELFVRAGIPTPDCVVLRKGQRAAYSFPSIVKPCSNGSSIGVKKAFSQAQLDEAVDEAFRYEDVILVERFHQGREFTCGVLGREVLPPAEVIPKGDFYDYAHKYQNGLITEICPARISEEMRSSLCELSLRVFDALCLSGYARMDFIYDESDGKFYCLEANTLPGLTPTSHLPQMAKAVGMSYEALCMKIIDLALAK